MAEQQMNNPLEGIDPILEDAFPDSHDLLREHSHGISGKQNNAVDMDYMDSPISEVQFPDLIPSGEESAIELDIFRNIPVDVSVELGRSKISLKEVYELSEGAIIELDRLVGEPLDLLVNGQVVAQGEVVAIDNNYGLRITEILAKKSNKE